MNMNIEDLAKEYVAAIARYYKAVDRGDEMENCSAWVVDKGVMVAGSTGNYMYRALVYPDGTIRDEVNWQAYQPDGIHSRLRKAKIVRAEVEKFKSDLLEMYTAYREKEQLYLKSMELTHSSLSNGNGEVEYQFYDSTVPLSARINFPHLTPRDAVVSHEEWDEAVQTAWKSKEV